MGVNTYTELRDSEGQQKGYSGLLYTSSTKRDHIDTGIQVKCGVTYDKNGTARPDQVWMSEDYLKKTKL